MKEWNKDSVTAQVVKILNEHFSRDDITVETLFNNTSTTEIDLNEAIDIKDELEQAFNIIIQDNDTDKFDRTSDWVALVCQALKINMSPLNDSEIERARELGKDIKKMGNYFDVRLVLSYAVENTMAAPDDEGQGKNLDKIDTSALIGKTLNEEQLDQICIGLKYFNIVLNKKEVADKSIDALTDIVAHKLGYQKPIVGVSQLSDGQQTMVLAAAYSFDEITNKSPEKARLAVFGIIAKAADADGTDMLESTSTLAEEFEHHDKDAIKKLALRLNHYFGIELTERQINKDTSVQAVANNVVNAWKRKSADISGDGSATWQQKISKREASTLYLQ